MKHTHTNYKAQYGITLKEAKAAARAILGRLPRCGYEVCVLTLDVPARWVKQEWDGKDRWLPATTQTIWLVNNAGSFYLRGHIH